MLEINFEPFPIRETPNLRLRRPSNLDADGVFKLRSNPVVMQFVPRPILSEKAEALEHLAMINSKIENNQGINWTITLAGNDNFIGIIGLFRILPDHFRAEIGYMILPEYSGKGYITEAIQNVMKYGFEIMGLHSIEAIIDPENYASAKVLEKNDFIKEAHFIQNEFYNGKFLNTAIYSLLNPNH